MLKRASIKIFGQVRGIGFRYFVKQKADEMKIVGFVKNEPEGSVLIVAEADKPILEKFIQSVKLEHHYAKINDVKIEWLEVAGEFTKFDITI